MHSTYQQQCKLLFFEHFWSLVVGWTCGWSTHGYRGPTVFVRFLPTTGPLQRIFPRLGISFYLLHADSSFISQLYHISLENLSCHLRWGPVSFSGSHGANHSAILHSLHLLVRGYLLHRTIISFRAGIESAWAHPWFSLGLVQCLSYSRHLINNCGTLMIYRNELIFFVHIWLYVCVYVQVWFIL